MRASGGLSTVALHLDGTVERNALAQVLARIFADAALCDPGVLEDLRRRNDPSEAGNMPSLARLILTIEDALKVSDYRVRLPFPVAEELLASLLDACPQRSVA